LCGKEVDVLLFLLSELRARDGYLILAEGQGLGGLLPPVLDPLEIFITTAGLVEVGAVASVVSDRLAEPDRFGAQEIGNPRAIDWAVLWNFSGRVLGGLNAISLDLAENCRKECQ
jgi:hypothetical protein